MLVAEDAVARYRYARALEAEGNHANARAHLEKIIAARAIKRGACASDCR